jgi:CDP-diacylglycerol---glycerol-3-phosphate 3-phosphatidyltransferase
VDDDVILSGANLSREYFTTRIDRYLHLRQPDLVQFYSSLVRVLCQHGAVRYGPPAHVDQGRGRFHSGHWVASIARRRQLQAALVELFTTKDPPSILYDPRDIVAYAIPTFQAPKLYARSSTALQLLNHEQTLTNLLEAVRSAANVSDDIDGQRRFAVTARVATAYMNPTRPFLDALARCCDRAVFLTAGMASHGFAPKKDQHQSLQRVEDQSRGWAIPNVFRHASRRAVRHITRQQQRRRHQPRSDAPEPLQKHGAAQVAYYQRPGWTFHAKGMWLSMQDPKAAPRDGPDKGAVTFSPTERLVAVCTGSGNYGARSALRDMESNLILIFPSTSGVTEESASGAAPSMQDSNPLVRQHVEEWNRLCKFASDKEEEPEPPRWVRFLYPWVRPFF